MRAGYIQKNVVLDTKPAKLVKSEICPLDEQQANDLVEISKQFGKVDSVAIIIALNTGMRLGEIFGLKWDCVNLDKCTIEVKRQLVTGKKGAQFQPPKTKSSQRKILLPAHVVLELKEFQEWQNQQKITMGDKYLDSNMVITNTIGNVYDTSNFTTRIFKKMLAVAGIEQKFKFHDLRHTHATMLLRRVVNPKVVMERLGHSSIKMTLDTYGHLMPDMQNSAVESLEKLFGYTK